MAGATGQAPVTPKFKTLKEVYGNKSGQEATATNRQQTLGSYNAGSDGNEANTDEMGRDNRYLPDATDELYQDNGFIIDEVETNNADHHGNARPSRQRRPPAWMRDFYAE